MTNPTTIFFGPDGTNLPGISAPPKIYLRTLLFSTGKRGLMIESLRLVAKRNETTQSFIVWVYGGANLNRGSGLFVGEEGITANHHFKTTKNESGFSFIAGDYKLELFAKTLSGQREKKIWETTLKVSESSAAAIQIGNTGIFFDWVPNTEKYVASIDSQPE
ncbi:MAG: hypothetical protein ACU0A2_11235 [Cognatishimia sp.]|uniref:hypothetical protein n=1 Tax=Cognatishimia sp. TaxID=2211648 RepID=UPI0040584BF7